MALAYLSLTGIENQVAGFDADIGTNRFYRYKIGKGARKTNGLELVDEIVHTSAVFENNDGNPFNSLFALKVPAKLFDRTNRFIQLYSFKDREGVSPAMSRVIEVIPELNVLDLPLSSSLTKNTMTTSATNTSTFNKCRSVSFSFEEPQLGRAMFLNALLDAAKILAPIAVKAITGLINKDSGGNAQTGGQQQGGNQHQQPTGDGQQIQQLINVVIDALKQNNGQATTPNQTTTPPGGPNNPAPPLPNSLAPPPDTKTPPNPPNNPPNNTNNTPPNTTEQVSKPQSLSFSHGFSYRRIGKKAKQPLSTMQVVDGGVLTGPMLATLLGPLIQQAPQLLQVLGDAPAKLLQVINAAKLQKQAQEQNYLSGLLAQVNKQMLLQQLLMHSNAAAPIQEPTMSLSFSTSDKITLSIEKGNPVLVNEKPKYVYNNADTITLLLHVNTTLTPPKKPIPKSIAHLVIKNAATGKMVFEKKYKLKDVFLNSMVELPILPEEIKSIPTYTDLLVSVDYVWQSKDSQKNSGKTAVHVIYLVEEYFLKDTRSAEGDSIPLSDVNKYRVFWNKIWEGGTKTKRRWEAALDTKYYIYYRYDQDSNARIETKLKVNNNENADEDDSSRRLTIEGRMKSGLEISPVELNKLLPDISSYPLLSVPQLKALKTDDLNNYFNQQAQTNLELKGRDEETGAIWVFPEVAIQKINLHKVTKTDPNGLITETAQETIHFPKPVNVHFIGVKTV